MKKYKMYYECNWKRWKNSMTHDILSIGIMIFQFTIFWITIDPHNFIGITIMGLSLWWEPND